MSVLYKALQKAAKDNEQRQPAASAAAFDPERLAGSGVIRASAPRGRLRIASLAFLGVAAVALGASFYFTTLAPESQVAVTPPPRLAPAAMPAPAAVTPPPQPASGPNAPAVTPIPPPAGVAPAAPQPQAVAAAPQAAVPTAAPAAAPAMPAPPAPAATPSTTAAPAPATAAGWQEPSAPTAAPPSSDAPKMAEKTPLPSPRPATAAREPMPRLAADSPARMLDPPISVHRSQIDLEGVGNAVQVRTVAQSAQDAVGSAYNALIRGEYDTALGFYNQALKQEPHSVLALLGRGTALQKLGRKDEARASYEQALKVDPQNREALSNITALEAERLPGDAMQKLTELEREYPRFSPIKAQIGMIYARMENYDAAMDYLRSALALTPEATLYQYNLALILDHLGRHEEAVGAYQQVLASMSAGRALPELSAADIERRLDYLRAR